MRLIKVICLSTLLASATASAQGPSIEIRGGVQGLKHKIPHAGTEVLAGAGVGLNYEFPLNNKWQFVTGVGVDYLRSKVELRDGIYSSLEVDESSVGFEYKVQTTGYSETQSLYAVSIPAKIQYRSGGKTGWYANGGVKFLIPFRMQFVAKADNITQSGYYPDYNIEVENLPQHGFGSANNWKAGGSHALGNALVSTAAAGVSFSVAKHLNLSAGLYVDYGITDMAKDTYNANVLHYRRNNIQPAGAYHLSNQSRMLAYGVQLVLQCRK